jgi:hypothetical protein
MAIGAGLGSSVGIATETTQGTSITPTHFLEYNSESMEMVKNTVTGKGLRAGGLYQRSTRRVVTSWGAAGGVNADVPFTGMGLWWQHMLGSFGSLNSVVQQASSAAYLQTHTPGPLAGNTFGMQIGKPDSTGTVRVFQYVGCKVKDWTLTSELNQFLKLALTINAWQELTADNPQGTTAAPSYTSPTYTAGSQQFHFRQGTIYNSGTLSNTGSGPTITSLGSPVAAGRLTKVEVKGENPTDDSRYFFGGTGGSGVAGVKGDQLDNEFRQITGSLSAEFYSLSAFYDTYAADTATTLELQFTGPLIASTYAYGLTVLIPVIKFDGKSPSVGGPGILNHDLPFHGLDDETHNPIQFAYMSTDLAI